MIGVAAGKIHTDAAVAAIQAVASVQNSTVLVGRGVQPAGSGWQSEPETAPFRPYVVVFPFPGTPDGPVAEPAEYLDYRAQATCVSASSEGAEVVADLVKTAWVNAPLIVPGRSSYPGVVTVERPVTRDDSISPAVHYSIIQVSWRTQAT